MTEDEYEDNPFLPVEVENTIVLPTAFSYFGSSRETGHTLIDKIKGAVCYEYRHNDNKRESELLFLIDTGFGTLEWRKAEECIPSASDKEYTVRAKLRPVH